MQIADIQPERLPRHIAIILDGNGRWAKKNGKLRQQGHKAGADNIEVIGDAMIEYGIPFLTVYAFSTENWKRSTEEVSYLMGLMKRYLMKNKQDALRKGIRIRVIGDRSKLSDDLQVLIREMERDTKDMTRLNLTFAINYGGRDEIVRAVRRAAQDVKQGILAPEHLDEAAFSAYLDTCELPDPDLMIRTSAEQRISNFLLWQLAYSEFYFSDRLWPDFTPEDLLAAIQDYASRERRFGGRVKEAKA